jgi:uncharacterized protein
MKKRNLLFIAIVYLTPVYSQLDFTKLQQEYMSRKPALDTMFAYPDIPYDSIKVLNAEGDSISFWWMPHKINKGTVLLVHGFLMNKSLMLSRAKIYYDLGYNAIVMDLRARGQSDGKTTTSGPEIRNDVIVVMEYYANKLNEYGPLILMGYSHGGRAVVFAAEKKPDLVKAIVLESIPYSLAESFKRTYKMEPPPIPEGNISKAFLTISKIPILLMIGSNDKAIIPEEAEKIKETFENSQSQLVVFDDAGHDLMIKKYWFLYIETLQSFLKLMK